MYESFLLRRASPVTVNIQSTRGVHRYWILTQTDKKSKLTHKNNEYVLT
jgi:hypothetical protein